MGLPAARTEEASIMGQYVSIRFLVLFALATVLARLASPVDAATVSLGLISKQTAPNDPAGEWELWAWTSAGDNDGISAYAIEMAGDGIAGQHVSPLLSYNGSGNASAGFITGRYQIPDSAMGTTLWAAQDALSFHIFYGVGSPDLPARITPPRALPDTYLTQEWWLNPAFESSPSIPPNSVPGDDPFSVPAAAVQLAAGISADYLTVEFGARTDVNVFTDGQAVHFGTEIESMQAALFLDRVPAVPEPNAMLILAILVFFSAFRVPKTFNN